MYVDLFKTLQLDYSGTFSHFFLLSHLYIFKGLCLGWIMGSFLSMHNLLVGSYGIIKCYTIILVAFGSGYAVCLLQTSSCIVRVSESPDFDAWLTKPNL